MSVAHCYPSQIESRWSNISPFILRARVRRVAGYAAMAGAGLALLLLQPGEVSAGSDALQSATLRSSIETVQVATPQAEAPAPRKVRVIPINKAD